MKTKAKTIGLGVALILFLGLAVRAFIAPSDEPTSTSTRFEQRTSIPSASAITTSPSVAPIATPTPQAPSNVLQTLPFVAQSPFGNWADSRQQDGCEEASVLMAAHWLKGTKTLSKQQGLDELLELSAFGETRYGTYHDTSITDTRKFFNDYYNHTATEIISDATVDDIIINLREGHLVIAPTNGRLLKNPNFTSPGPEYHMLVIIGFDNAKKEFITHDPGTRQGALYRYPYARLFNAIADYNTGVHVPRFSIEKTILVVKKS